MRPLHSVDPYGFERSNNFDYDSYEQLMSEYLAVLTKRSIKWSKLLQGKSRIEKSLKGECELSAYLHYIAAELHVLIHRLYAVLCTWSIAID